MADSIYGEFSKKAKTGSSASDKQYNQALLFGIIAAHPDKLPANRRGATQYLLFSNVSTTLGSPAIQVADENNGTYVITLLAPTGKGTVATSGIDFYGDINAETDFIKNFAEAFSR